MNYKDLKQLPRETKVGFSALVNPIAYHCGNAFSLEDKISTFIFGVQSAIQTIVAHETEELKDTRRTFENFIQIARKEGKSNRARLPKFIVTCEAVYASPHRGEDKDETLMMYGKRRGRLFQSFSKRVVQPPRIPGPTINYRQDCPGWIDQPLPQEKSAASPNIVCHQCYTHGHYSLDCQLPYGRWKEVIATL